MDGMQQIVIPVLGIVAAAAVTFYAVSFSELSEKSFRELDEKEAAAAEEGVKFQPNMSSRERRARKKADKKSSS